MQFIMVVKECKKKMLIFVGVSKTLILSKTDQLQACEVEYRLKTIWASARKSAREHCKSPYPSVFLLYYYNYNLFKK